MTEERNKLNHFAMEYGLLLGAYFILKFGITVISSKILVLSILSWILLIGIPFVIYWMLRNFRDRQNAGVLEFGKAWSLSMLLIFFASLPEALAQYAYFQFINPAYIHEQISQITTALESLSDLKESPAMNELINNYKSAAAPSPIQMAFQGIFNNLFFGGLISLAIAAVVKRTAPTNISR
ncbi:MAG: DUF4199 domain-containing protein [Bacteroidales bacterium]